MPKPLTRQQTKGLSVADIRRAVADYMHSEGCSCCRNVEAHTAHEERLAKLLKVPKYKDGSGYDFTRFRTKPTRSAP